MTTTTTTATAVDQIAVLRHELRSVGALYEELATHLVLTGPPGEHRRGSGTPGIPLNGRAVEVRGDILTVLASWAGLVVDERRVTAPRRAVPDLVAFLDRHASWLVGHPAGAEAVGEIHGLVRAGNRVVHGSASRTLPVGRCTAARCGGTLVARLRTLGNRREPVIQCTNDSEHVWSSDSWHAAGAPRRADGGSGGGRTGDRFGGAGGARSAGGRLNAGGFLGVDEIAAGWNVPPGTVYWLAKSHAWARRREGRRTVYSRADVLRTMSERHGAERHGAERQRA